MIKQICQFVAAAGLVGIALTPISASAKTRVLDGHACRVATNWSAGSASQIDCPIPVGSDFNPATIGYVEVDGFTQGWFQASGCRRSYSGYTQTCGTTNTRTYNTATAYVEALDVSALRGGGPYDYRWVKVLQKNQGDDTFNVSGVYVSNSDP